MPENKRFQAQQIGDAARVIDTEGFFLVEGRPKTVEWFNSFEEAQAEADKLNRIYGHASDEPKCEGYYYYGTQALLGVLLVIGQKSSFRDAPVGTSGPRDLTHSHFLLSQHS